MDQKAFCRLGFTRTHHGHSWHSPDFYLCWEWAPRDWWKTGKGRGERAALWIKDKLAVDAPH